MMNLFYMNFDMTAALLSWPGSQ